MRILKKDSKNLIRWHSYEKFITLLVALILLFPLSACGKSDNTAKSSTDDIPSTIIPSDTITPNGEQKEDESYLSKSLVLTIDSSEVDVY